MGKQIFNLKGMMRDIDPAKAPNQFAYEIRNLRLTAQEDSTILALVSEKGNTQYTITGDSISGNIVGYCVLKDYLVLFTCEMNGLTHIGDYIYRLSMNNLSMESTLIYRGDLGFDKKGVKLETMGVYENDDIQKVYWIDGVHQLRFINIKTGETITDNVLINSVPAMNLREAVLVRKTNVSGIFNSGTIQYFLCYYNKHGSQSATFYQTQLYYIAPNGRGASPEEVVSNAFEIVVSNFDSNFEYVRVIAAQRTSQNGTPTYRIVADVPISNAETTSIPIVSQSFVAADIQNEPAQTQNQRLEVYLGDDMVEEMPLESFLSNTQSATFVIPSGSAVVPNEFNTRSEEIMRSGYTLYLYTGKFEDNKEIVHKISGVTQADYRANSNAQGTERLPVNNELIVTTTLNNGLIQYNITADIGSSTTVVGFVNRTESIVTSTQLHIIDNGLGEATDLSMFQSYDIVPKTMERKSNTLFLGNYSFSVPVISKGEADIIKNGCTIKYSYKDGIDTGSLGGFYSYVNELDLGSSKITTFKGGETYHFGIMLQNELGIWTSVIDVGSKLNDKYPRRMGSTKVQLVKAILMFDANALEVLSRYKRFKVVTLKKNRRQVIAQGVLCPTVFNKNRSTNSPYAQSSWFFRTVEEVKSVENIPQNKNFGNIISSTAIDMGEIQGASEVGISYYDSNPNTYEETDMFIDWNLLTLHSPDLQFDDVAIPSGDIRMRIVGYTPVTSGITSHFLSLASPTRGDSVYDWLNTIVHFNNDPDAAEVQLASFAFYDKKWDNNDYYYYQLFPWERQTSLGAQPSVSGSESWYAQPDIKVFSSLRESSYTKYLEKEDIQQQTYEITQPSLVGGLNNSKLVSADQNNNQFSTERLYLANVDAILTNVGGYKIYGKRSGTVTALTSGCTDGIRMRYKSDNHAVFSLKTIGNTMFIPPNVGSNTLNSASVNLNAYPYSCVSGLSGVIDLSNTTWEWITGVSPYYTELSITMASIPFNVGDLVYVNGTNNTNTDIWQVKSIDTGNSKIILKSLDENFYNTYGSQGQYKEKIEYYTDMVGHIPEEPGLDPHYNTNPTYEVGNSYYDVYSWWFYYIDSPNSQIKFYRYDYYILHFQVWRWVNNAGWVYDWTQDLYYRHMDLTNLRNLLDTVLVDTEAIPAVLTLGQKPLTINAGDYHYLYLAELYYNDVPEDNIENAEWDVASESRPVSSQITASIGDTYYQRYDCLKTSPYSLEDHNQVTEIFSFMCECRMNIDGRYDEKRGQADNTAVTLENFNLLNKAYTQDDNIETFSYLNPDDYSLDNFPNQITWSLTKTYGEKIDSWTRVNLTSTLDMDGTLGEVRALKLWNDNLLCFQDMGIARIMYNDRTTMSTEQGIPVEIANSGKVDGSQYVTNQIGCSNKESIQVTQEGIYFIDNNNRELYRLSKSLESLSKSKGFNSYFYDSNINLNSEKTFYDPKLKDVYFRFEKAKAVECLVYNEQIGEFTSFFDYNMDFMFSFKDALISVEHNSNHLWKQFASASYLRYFGEIENSEPVYKDYSIEIVSAENPIVDKTFTGVEFRADVLSGNITLSNVQSTTTGSYASINKLPFKTIQAWNEYQDTGAVSFDRMLRKGMNLSQKFRIWRGDIGRDTIDTSHPLNRIRSPWARIKLTGSGDNMKTVIHDITVSYV